jgi:hypothetical protein
MIAPKVPRKTYEELLATPSDDSDSELYHEFYHKLYLDINENWQIYITIYSHNNTDMIQMSLVCIDPNAANVNARIWIMMHTIASINRRTHIKYNTSINDALNDKYDYFDRILTKDVQLRNATSCSEVAYILKDIRR